MTTITTDGDETRAIAAFLKLKGGDPTWECDRIWAAQQLDLMTDERRDMIAALDPLDPPDGEYGFEVQQYCEGLWSMRDTEPKLLLRLDVDRHVGDIGQPTLRDRRTAREDCADDCGCDRGDQCACEGCGCEPCPACDFPGEWGGPLDPNAICPAVEAAK